MKYLLLPVLSLLAFLLGTCNSKSDNPVPQVYVREEVFLTAYGYKLNNPPNYIYLRGGVRGIILYKSPNGIYYAFERNCTYNPNDSCATVSADATNLFYVDKCCGSKWGLEGNLLQGPARYNLVQYRTTYLPADNKILITND